MKVMQKRIYDKGDNILNSYQFDDINGIVDINKTLSILLESGVLIEEIIINEFGIKQELKVGENIIEFTPTKEETITYTCWMKMIKNTIKVIDDEDYFKGG